MSIESDKDRSKNRSDIMDKLDEGKRYSMSNKNSTEMVLEQRGGSFGNSVGSVQVELGAQKGSSWGEVGEHSCDCYRTCIGKECNCFNFMEPCIPTRCCNECVQMKKELLNEYMHQRQNEALYSIFPSNPSPPTSLIPAQQDYTIQPQPVPLPPVLKAPHQPLLATEPPTPDETEDYEPVCACKKTRCLKMYC